MYIILFANSNLTYTYMYTHIYIDKFITNSDYSDDIYNI